MDVASGEVIEVLDAFVFTPLNELFEPVVVCLDRRVKKLVAAIIEVHFFRGAWVKGFQVV